MTRFFVPFCSVLLLLNCGASVPDAVTDEPTATSSSAVSCFPQMSLFPVGAEHNIGYDNSCRSGTCPISCPDSHANSDWNGRAGHHGIDIFAFRGAPIVAVADGTVVRVGVVSSTSGLRVRLRDDCGWEYYYGHLDSASVVPGQRVTRGTALGTMGNTGTSGVHLHFNVSPEGRYSEDFDPFDLLVSTSATACQAPVDPPSGCGTLLAGQVLNPNDSVTSCDQRFVMVMQTDGNLVLYQNGVGAIWASRTSSAGSTIAAMQDDGNLVVYSAQGVPLWSSGTNGSVGARLVVQDDGNAVLYANGRAVWNSGTSGR